MLTEHVQFNEDCVTLECSFTVFNTHNSNDHSLPLYTLLQQFNCFQSKTDQEKKVVQQQN